MMEVTVRRLTTPVAMATVVSTLLAAACSSPERSGTTQPEAAATASAAPGSIAGPAASTTTPAATPTSTGTPTTAALPDRPSGAPVTTLTTVALPPVSTVPRQGAEIGTGSIGSPIRVPQPWPMSTIYSGLEPDSLLITFVPPDRDCIAAQANATIGRGGAILIGLWVEGDRSADAECPDAALRNELVLDLAEALDGRRLYSSTVPVTRGESARAEATADAIVGLPTTDALEIIDREGFEVRDVTGATEVEDDFNPDRINITRVGGRIEFATVS